MMNILNVIKGFIGTHKLASIITASVVGVGAIGGTTAGVIHAVNNNDNEDTEVTTQANVNATDLTASALEGQEINLADLQDVTEEVQADGTSVIKDKNGVVVAKKDASGKTTLTKDGGVALSTGSVQASGDLANNVSNAQAQTQTYVASLPANNSNVSYTASTPSTPSAPATSSNTQASTPTFTSQPQISQPVGCSHNWVYVPEKTHIVHHDAVVNEWDEPIYEMKSYWVCECGYKCEDKTEFNKHLLTHMGTGAEGTHRTWKEYENVQVGTEHRSKVLQPAYDETVVDSPAYTYCSKCGQRQ